MGWLDPGEVALSFTAKRRIRLAGIPDDDVCGRR